MREVRGNIYSGICFLLFGIFVYVGSFWIPATTSDILGSRFFPRVVAVLIGLLSVVQIVTALSQEKTVRARADGETGGEEKGGGFKLNKPLVLTVLALFVYYILILQIGFTITSIVYLLFQSWVLMSADDLKNKKKVIVMVVVAIIVPIAINMIFWRIFSIALPAGKLLQ